MEYVGHTQSTTAVATVDASCITPKDFFDRYIATRTPVVLRGVPEYLACTSQWSNSYLRSVVGDADVTVEHRESATAGFGRGTTTKMPFASLLDLFEQGSTMHYLTTQPTDDNADDDNEQLLKEDSGGGAEAGGCGKRAPSTTRPPAPARLSVLDAVPAAGLPPLAMAPAAQLLQAKGGPPVRPALLGALCPANINVWMGKSIEGSSSGLHHDYHDNLYVLLRGRKRFRLHSPNDTDKMYTVGDVAKVHCNGRINYHGFPLTDAAGVPERNEDDTAAAAAAALRCRLAAAAAAAEEGGSAAEEDAEEEMDAALEAALDADMLLGSGHGDDYDDGEDEEEAFSEEEDFEDGDEPGMLVSDGTGVLLWAPGTDGAAGTAAAPATATKRRRLCVDQAASSNSRGERKSDAPPNFSRVGDTAAACEEGTATADAYPLYKTAAVTVCEIEAGDMLYLPTGWFHEVSSFSTGTSTGGGGGGGIGAACGTEASVHEHLALNYWVHPPDTDSFEAPYSTSYWTDEWKLRAATN